MNNSGQISAFIEKIDGKYRFYAFLGVLLVVFLLDYFILMSPQLAALQRVGSENKALLEDLRKANDDTQKLTGYQNDLQQLKDQMQEINLKIRSRREVPIILERISELADKDGVRIDQIMPDTLDQELLFEADQRKYYALPVYVEARSGYHNVGRFLNKIEQDGMSLSVDTFTISATSDNLNHVLKLTLKVIVFEDENL